MTTHETPKMSKPRKPPPSQMRAPETRSHKRGHSDASDPTGASVHDLQRDGLAEELGESFLRNATSGEQDLDLSFEEIVAEESGGPFVETTEEEEIARDEDPSNPPGATREPFPKS